ncbi:MAG: 50S ribosomal protein L25 [Candidatus Beckwithbacteria bacterium]|nr:50S ribosomal protein L25 [Patescibacteria group bacterium]
MSSKITLKVQTRKITGSKVKKLRKEGLLPANIYGKGIKSLSIKLTAKDFKEVLEKAGETSIVELTVDKEAKTRPVLIQNPQLHPVTDEYLHVDFRQVDLTKKISVQVPVILIGTAPATNKGGILLQLMEEIEVEALPSDLPDKFEININGLEEIGQGITLKEVKVGSKVKLILEDLDALIVKIEEPAKEEEVIPVETEEVAEGEEAEAKEGDVVAEGEDTQIVKDKKKEVKK